MTLHLHQQTIKMEETSCCRCRGMLFYILKKVRIENVLHSYVYIDYILGIENLVHPWNAYSFFVWDKIWKLFMPTMRAFFLRNYFHIQVKWHILTGIIHICLCKRKSQSQPSFKYLFLKSYFFFPFGNEMTLS